MAVEKNQIVSKYNERLNATIKRITFQIDNVLVTTYSGGPVRVDIGTLDMLFGVDTTAFKTVISTIINRYTDAGWKVTSESGMLIFE